MGPFTFAYMNDGYRAFTTVAAGVLIAACGTSIVPTLMPRDTPAATARDVLPSATSVPPSNPTASPTAQVAPALHVDGMATVAVNRLRQVVDPLQRGGGNDNRSLSGVRLGTELFLVDMAVVNGVPYWLVAPDRGNPYVPLGWVPEKRGDNQTLSAFEPRCPSRHDLTAAALVEISGNTAVACFGDQQLEVAGDLACYSAIVDAMVAGPSWLSEHASCKLDDQLSLAGRAVFSLLDPPEVDTVVGRYLLRGHFDDVESAECGWIPFGTTGMQPSNPGEPAAVMLCRGQLVVTSAQLLASPSPG